MAKDYGKKPAPSRKAGSSSKTLWFVACFLGGYLCATMMDVEKITEWVNTQLVARQLTQPVLVKPKIEQQVSLPKPKFEFYTLLANEPSSQIGRTEAQVIASKPTPAPVATLPVPKDEIASVSTNIASAIQSTDVKKGYLLQVGSFRSAQEAERIKASLTLKGFVVNVSVISQQQTQWYRVVIGPFASRDEAEKAQTAVARTEHVTGMIRKMDA